MTKNSTLLEDLGDRVLIRLNRPQVRNAIDQQMADSLNNICADLEATPRTALLMGAGDHFAAGADIAQLRKRRHEDALRGINSSVFDRIRRLPMPTIALLDGYTLGGGAELAYACDFRICTSRTRIGNPEVGLGIIAAAGACWRLVELVGEPLAKEVLMAGRILNSDEALSARLVQQVVEPDDLLPAGHDLADRLARQGQLALRLTKAVLHAPRASHPLVDELAQAILFETDEKEQRMTGFLERRKDRPL